MSSDKDKRNKAEALLSQCKQETSTIEELDPAIQQYLDQRFNKIEEMLEKILKRIDWKKLYNLNYSDKHNLDVWKRIRL